MLEGSRYGKNRIGPMGYHWLVAVFVFSAEITCAEFTASDSANLAQIESFVGVMSLDTGSTVTELSIIRPRVVSVEQHAKYILDALAGNPVTVPNINNTNNIYSRVRAISSVIDAAKRQYAEGGKTLVALAVTNTHESLMLNKIYDVLQVLTNQMTNSSYMGPYTVYYSVDANGVPGSYDNVESSYEDLKSLFGGEYEAYAWGDYGIWRLLALSVLAPLNEHNHLLDNLSSRFIHEQYSNAFGAHNYSSFSNFGIVYDNLYGTSRLTMMVTNFLYSAYHNGTFDPIILAQLANPDEVNALVSSSQVSNSIGNVVGALKDTGLVGTNDVYTGTYETNGVLAEISTNDYHNSGYSSFANDMSSNAIARKITSFNFDQKFEEGLKPFLDEMSAGSGSDWIINFGNITLGDFSYTIPAVTLQRNTVYLSYVDRAFDIMKAISTVCFFLLLWNTLVAASKDG